MRYSKLSHKSVNTDFDISLLEQMTNANVGKASTIVDTAIKNTVNQRKQNRHRGMK